MSTTSSSRWTCRYVFFDVAGTLLYKPLLYDRIQSTLASFAIPIDSALIAHRHRILSEVTQFPPATSETFYRTFNAQLLCSLGIVPTEPILAALFGNCSGLSWSSFGDVDGLDELGIPCGVISNWDSSLE